jgi:hypothetical protein
MVRKNWIMPIIFLPTGDSIIVFRHCQIHLFFLFGLSFHDKDVTRHYAHQLSPAS